MKQARTSRLLGTFITLAIVGTASHSAVFDRDDRVYVSTAPGSPYSPVGMIIGGHFRQRLGTGFLVDQCHALTLQHVAAKWKNPVGHRLIFRGAVGTPSEVTTRATIVAAGNASRRRKASGEIGDRDWLLLRLDECLGNTLGYADLMTGPFSPFEFRDLQSAGFPKHRDSRALTVDPSCRITASYRGVWLDDCATMMRDGGGPIFRISNSNGRRRMLVYAMKYGGQLWKKPVPLAQGDDNWAIPMSTIAPIIHTLLAGDAGTVER